MKQLAIKTTLALISSLCAMTSPIWAQDAASEEAAKKAAEPTRDQHKVKIWRDFMNLPEAKRKEFGSKLIKAQNLYNQKRIFDTLEKTDELDKIFPNHPSTLNFRGACYVELRSFDKARAVFAKAIAMDPNNLNLSFNIAEIDFVTKKWQSAHDGFEKLLAKLPPQNKSMLRLCEFKLLLSKLKIGQVKEATTMSEKYDEWDDSPYYYYSRAAIAYHKDNKEEADKFLRHARFVWRNDAALAVWQDTMIEYGYIRSFYAGDFEDEDAQ